MKKELELKLVEKYPKILRDYNGDVMQTCMCWGMECDDGWYELLDKCMEKIQYCCDKFSSNENEVQVVADQIKEKLGTLSFYYTAYGANEIEDSIIYDLVSGAERESQQTCEETGERGELCCKGRWYKTLSYEKARELGYVASNPEVEKYWQTKDVKKAQELQDANQLKLDLK